MKRSFYQQTTRITPGEQVQASAAPTDSYEQPFPGYEDDFLYFTRLYPVAVRPYVVPVRSAFDKLEYNGSLLFDRYPDREALLRMADEIIQSDDANRDLLLMLMLHELMHRRERYRHNQNL